MGACQVPGAYVIATAVFELGSSGARKARRWARSGGLGGSEEEVGVVGATRISMYVLSELLRGVEWFDGGWGRE